MFQKLSRLIVFLVVLVTPACTGLKASEGREVHERLDRHEKILEANRELLKNIDNNLDHLQDTMKEHMEKY